jgi:transketolase
MYGATFLIFSDYMRPPIRLAAMNGLPVIYVFTHDSIGLGEDGPTHQPVEQLLGLRSVPGLTVIRPADANETFAAWEYVIAHRTAPIALILTRQKLPILGLMPFAQISENVARGGYILSEIPQGSRLNLILIATGSEVHLALEAQRQLLTENIFARVVSLPCVNLFEAQTSAYKDEILTSTVPWLVIEAGVTLGWRSYLQSSVKTKNLEVIGVDHFGASAPGERVMTEYGFNITNICQRAKSLCQAELKNA